MFLLHTSASWRGVGEDGENYNPMMIVYRSSFAPIYYTVSSFLLEGSSFWIICRMNDKTCKRDNLEEQEGIGYIKIHLSICFNQTDEKDNRGSEGWIEWIVMFLNLRGQDYSRAEFHIEVVGYMASI